MDDLFFFDNVVNAIQGGNPLKKRSKRQLVKAVSLSQGSRNSQSASEDSRAVDVEAILSLSIIPTILAF